MVHSAYFVPRLQSRSRDSVHSTFSLHSSSVNNFAHFKVTISHWHCVYMRTSIRICVYICIRICVLSFGGIVSRWHERSVSGLPGVCVSEPSSNTTLLLSLLSYIIFPKNHPPPPPSSSFPNPQTESSTTLRITSKKTSTTLLITSKKKHPPPPPYSYPKSSFPKLRHPVIQLHYYHSPSSNDNNGGLRWWWQCVRQWLRWRQWLEEGQRAVAFLVFRWSMPLSMGTSISSAHRVTMRTIFDIHDT